MTNEWRIAGGLGITPDPRDPDQVVMLQGIGFPLRPVDNVPATDTPPLGDGLVAEGLFMQWMGLWGAGQFYAKGSYVQDGTFTCVALRLTLEKPSPVPSAAPTFILPTPWTLGTSQSDVAVVACSHNITFTSNGWIKKLRIFAPDITATVSYRIIVTNVTRGTTLIIDDPNTTLDDWATVTFLNEIISSGENIVFTLEASNSSAKTDVDGSWTYQGPTQTGAPPAQNWTVDNQRILFRIDKTDLDGTDRSTGLESVLPTSTIIVVETANSGNNATYLVDSVVDSGTYMTYNVVLQNEAGGGPSVGSITSIEIDVPIPLATEYEDEALFFPTGNPAWATITSTLFFDGVDQVAANTTAYGIDIEFEPAAISLDWDIVTST